jgi:transcriptional repressor NrdR
VRCPFCKEDSDKVIDSRSSDAGRIIRRRRECLACKRRFTTYEKSASSSSASSRDGSRVPYDREKWLSASEGQLQATVSADQIQEVADRIEEDVFCCSDKEVISLSASGDEAFASGG